MAPPLLKPLRARHPGLDLGHGPVLLAKPCCWMAPGPNCGKQCGMPPEMGFEPSILASGRTMSVSTPSLTYEVTHAPNVYTSPFLTHGCLSIMTMMSSPASHSVASHLTRFMGRSKSFASPSCSKSR